MLSVAPPTLWLCFGKNGFVQILFEDSRILKCLHFCTEHIVAQKKCDFWSMK